MDQTASGKAPHKIANITAGLMIGLALLMDGIQFLLTLTVIAAPLSILITFFAACIFGVWFAVLGISYFGGKKKGLKLLSLIGSMVIEFVPIIDGLPAITGGVIGIIVSTRLEELKQGKQQPGTNTSVRFSGPQKLPQAANNNGAGEEYSEAA